MLLAVAAGAAASAVLLPDEVRISSRGDWRAVSEGLRRWSDRETVVAGPRFLVHAHDCPVRATHLRDPRPREPGRVAGPADRLDRWPARPSRAR